MNEYELTDEEIKKELLLVADRYYDAEVTVTVSHTAVARAAQKKLVEWLLERDDEHLQTQSRNCPKCWQNLRKELGIK